MLSEKTIKKVKAQSAMEYLMTYGWAIIVIAIVIAALYVLGVFNGTSGLGNTCIALSGFYCSTPILNNTGNMLITVGQVGSTITLSGIECTNQSTTPNSGSMISQGNLVLGSFSKVPLTFHCPITSNSLGSSFSGNLWIQYNTSYQTDLITKIAVFNARVSTFGVLLSSSGGGGSCSASPTVFNIGSPGSSTSIIVRNNCNHVFFELWGAGGAGTGGGGGYISGTYATTSGNTLYVWVGNTGSGGSGGYPGGGVGSLWYGGAGCSAVGTSTGTWNTASVNANIIIVAAGGGGAGYYAGGAGGGTTGSTPAGGGGGTGGSQSAGGTQNGAAFTGGGTNSGGGGCGYYGGGGGTQSSGGGGGGGSSWAASSVTGVTNSGGSGVNSGNTLGGNSGNAGYNGNVVLIWST